MTKKRRDLTPLAGLALLEGCSLAELARVAEAVEADEVLEPGRVVCGQGRVARAAYLVVEGTADVLVRGERVAEVGPGQCVGESGVLDHRPRTATVVARTPLRVLAIGERRFRRLLDEVPAFGAAVRRGSGERLDELGRLGVGPTLVSS